jgi:hypothetical protein
VAHARRDAFNLAVQKAIDDEMAASRVEAYWMRAWKSVGQSYFYGLCRISVEKLAKVALAVI